MSSETPSPGVSPAMLTKFLENPLVSKLRDAWAVEKSRVAIARTLISLYFLNVWWSNLQMWAIGRERFPWVGVFLIIPTGCLVMSRHVKVAGFLLLAEVCIDNGLLLSGVYQTWQHRGVWYVNELMVKKLSMLGCTLLVLLMAFDKKMDSLAGLLMPELNVGPTNRQSLILLASRFLVTSLFIWAGQAEIFRQLASVHSDGQGHQVHDRPPGDGHDQLWAKCLQFICSLPLCVGFRTKEFCSCLALVCCLEALLMWTGLAGWLGFGSGFVYDWADLGMFYKVHSREHFVVNVSVAGGLILLQNFGAGKFSVDAMMKKKD